MNANKHGHAVGRRTRRTALSDEIARLRTPAGRLRALFRESGYVRTPNDTRREKERSAYKKGWEVRLVIDASLSTEEVLRDLAAVGLKAGRPFSKRARTVIPVYGRDSVAWFAGASASKPG